MGGTAALASFSNPWSRCADARVETPVKATRYTEAVPRGAALAFCQFFLPLRHVIGQWARGRCVTGSSCMP